MGPRFCISNQLSRDADAVVSTDYNLRSKESRPRFTIEVQRSEMRMTLSLIQCVSFFSIIVKCHEFETEIE